MQARLTPEGLWWAVDSTVAVNQRSLSNVRHYYRTGHNPVAWGRYVVGHYAVHRDELQFASRHHIALYFLVPDANCSGCGGGDACGNDITASQARHDADRALAAARRLHLPPGVALFKDLEEVGACDGELSATYVLAWFHRVRRSPYRPAFYGNTTRQRFDFPRAFCAAAKRESDFLPHIVLAQDEPEPDIGAPQGSIGPRNAPHFKPKHPFCTTRAATSIWQYGESLSDDNLTDVDEIRPGTPGLLAPGGTVTG